MALIGSIVFCSTVYLHPKSSNFRFYIRNTFFWTYKAIGFVRRDNVYASFGFSLSKSVFGGGGYGAPKIYALHSENFGARHIHHAMYGRKRYCTTFFPRLITEVRISIPSFTPN